MAQLVKNLPAVQETQVCSLAQEDPLEKGMATHSSIPAWRIPWTEEPGGLQFMRLQRVGHNWVTNTFPFTGFVTRCLIAVECREPGRGSSSMHRTCSRVHLSPVEVYECWDVCLLPSPLLDESFNLLWGETSGSVGSNAAKYTQEVFYWLAKS